MAMEQNNPIIKNPDMKQYFDTLPAFVQETIEQSGVMPSDLNALKRTAENLMSKQ